MNFIIPDIIASSMNSIGNNEVFIDCGHIFFPSLSSGIQLKSRMGL